MVKHIQIICRQQPICRILESIEINSFQISGYFWSACKRQPKLVKAILHYTEYKRKVAATSLLLLHMRKSFVYWRFPEMSIPLKSRNYFNFSTPNKCRFLFKPIILVASLG